MKSKVQSAFTLIEILIAVAVFAVLATICASVLYSTVSSQAHIKRFTHKNQHLQLVLAVLSQDMHHIINNSQLQGDLSQITFIRKVPYAPFLPVARPVNARIQYYVSNNLLIRRHYQQLIPGTKQRYREQVMLPITAFTISYYKHLVPYSTWPRPSNEPKSLPDAIGLTIETEHGTLPLLYRLKDWNQHA